MEYRKYEDDFGIPSESSKIAKSSKYNSKLSGIMDRAHSINVLHLMVASCQLLLGLSVVFTSTLGLIEPFWLSTALTMFGSVASMIGIYFLYTVAFSHRDPNRLLRDAMRRIMDAQN